MGRKRKDFSDKFKIEVAKEALKKRAKEAEVDLLKKSFIWISFLTARPKRYAR